MDQKIETTSQIELIFRKLVNRSAELTVFFKWIDKQDSDFNLVVKISDIDFEQRQLIFSVTDVPETLLEGFFYQYDRKVHVSFIEDMLRYTFEMEALKIERNEEVDGFILYTTIPETGEFRQIRRAVRLLNNLPENLDPEVCYVYDISMTGLGLLTPPDLELPDTDLLDVELNVPILMGPKQYSKPLRVLAQLVRRAEYSLDHMLSGLEFVKLSEIDRALVYRYVLQRKNEFLTHKHIMPSMDVISIIPGNPANFEE